MIDDILNPYIDDKIEELSLVIENLKTDHEKEVKRKEYIISELEGQISKFKCSGMDSLDSNNDLGSTSIRTLEEELRKKNDIIVKMEIQLKEEKDVVREMAELIEELRLEKADAMKVSFSKDRDIDNLQKNKVFLENKIADLQKQVEYKESEIQSLEMEKSYIQPRNDKSLSTSETDISSIDNTHQYLFVILKEKDDKIRRMKDKISHMKDLNNQTNAKSKNGVQTFEQQFDSVNYAVDKLNKVTNNKFDSFGQCINFVQTLFEDSQKKMKKEFNREDVYPSDNGYNSNQQRILNKDNEELQDRIYDLELKLKSNEKRYKNKIQEKNDEIDELREEIDNAKTIKPKDLRNKARLKELEEKIEELESQLEFKCEEMVLKDKKMKDTLQDLNLENTSLNEKCGRLKREIQQRKEDELRLKSAHEDELKEIREIIDQKDREIESCYQDQERLAAETREEVQQISMELENCRHELDVEKDSNSQFNAVSKEQSKKIGLLEDKIGHLEKEIRNYRINKFQNKDFTSVDRMEKPEVPNWQPPWWGNHVEVKVEKPQKKFHVVCPICGELKHVQQIEQHIKQCC